jgi:hypothetical protein
LGSPPRCGTWTCTRRCFDSLYVSSDDHVFVRFVCTPWCRPDNSAARHWVDRALQKEEHLASDFPTTQLKQTWGAMVCNFSLSPSRPCCSLGARGTTTFPLVSVIGGYRSPTQTPTPSYTFPKFPPTHSRGLARLPNLPLCIRTRALLCSHRYLCLFPSVTTHGAPNARQASCDLHCRSPATGSACHNLENVTNVGVTQPCAPGRQTRSSHSRGHAANSSSLMLRWDTARDRTFIHLSEPIAPVVGLWSPTRSATGEATSSLRLPTPWPAALAPRLLPPPFPTSTCPSVVAVTTAVSQSTPAFPATVVICLASFVRATKVGIPLSKLSMPLSDCRVEALPNNALNQRAAAHEKMAAKAATKEGERCWKRAKTDT